MTRQAFVIVDLGFGDAGKGLLTDYWVRRTGARRVVRYNGGAQAGHNVVTPDGRHHTFAQFGAGTFVEGVQTFLSRHVVVHPTALLAEAAALRRVGVTDAIERLRVSEAARVITPFHQAANRLRELARGASRHGSCGVGVGETVQDDRAFPDDTVRVGDLRDGATLARKLARVCERKRAEMRDLAIPAAGIVERSVFDDASIAARWMECAAQLVSMGVIVKEPIGAALWDGTEHVVFEGAQGVLLDERHGFHPYSTWSNCTASNARELVAEANVDAEIVTMGVMRSHVVRHGPGPLPTERETLRAHVQDHNVANDWQGAVRYGWFDAVLARRALAIAGPISQIAVTHVDAAERVGSFGYCDAYDGANDLDGIGGATPEESAAEWTVALSRAVPRIETCGSDETVARIERLLRRPVDLVSRGPSAGDVSLRRP